MSAMAIVKLVLQIILVIFSLLLTLLILMHKGKGGGLSDMFGGGLTPECGFFRCRGKEPESLDRHHRGAVGCHHHCPRSDDEVRSHLIGFLLRPMTGLQSWAEVFFIVVLSTTYELRIDLTSLKIEKTQETTMVVADLDGTLLHDGETFEERFLTQRSIDVINRMHDNGVTFVVETARPVSTGFSFVEKLPVDAVAYLNGALIDFNPASSNYEMLTSPMLPEDGHLKKIGFSSQRACEVCKNLLNELPGMEVGIVMDDVRYTNFDVTKYWKTQTWRYTDFDDVPEGIADKLIIFPNDEQRNQVGSLVPNDFDVHISEGSLWMLMNPQANKEHALDLLAEHFETPMSNTVSFGDDLVDIAMLRKSGRGVAVANANPDVLNIADEICPSNNDDGVAQWIEDNLL